jgi:hypothetical protein
MKQQGAGAPPELYCKQLDALRALRQQVQWDLVAENNKHIRAASHRKSR